MTEHPKLLLIDGHSLAYRAFYALPVENFSTSTGQATNAVYGFVSMLINVLRDEEPTHCAVAFDLGRETFRLEKYPEYKAGRTKTPEEFHGQVELIKDVLTALRIPVVTKAGFEADDVLATLATAAAAENVPAAIVTGDKDAFQLVDDTVTVLYPKRGVSELARMTPAAVEEKYGVTPANYRGLAALTGEKADNLPGVPGVGDKTAAKWLAAHGSLPEVVANAADIGGKVGQSLRDHLPDVERNYELNALVTDLDLDIDVAGTARQDPDAEAINELLDQLEFQVLGKRMAEILDLSGATGAARTAAVEITTAQVPVAELVTWLTARSGRRIGCDTDSVYRLGRGDVRFLACADDTEARTTDLSEASPEDLTGLGAALRDCRLVLHGAKTQLKALWDLGLDTGAPVGDSAIAAYLLVPDRRAYELADLSSEHLGHTLEDTGAGGDQLSLDLDTDDTALLHGERAGVVLRLETELRQQIEAAHMEQVYDDIEIPLLPILAQMEATGVAVDRTALSELIDDFTSRAEQSAQDAYNAIGHEVNLGSPKQLQGVLFDELDMPKTKRTKTGYTTDAEALAELFVKTGHPFLEHLLAHRDTTKLKQTVVGLQKTVAEDGRIHTTYRQTVAATGRLSSTDPNLQNIPVRTEAGRRIREIFVAADDGVHTALLTADYSQIEMRIMAHLSGDADLIAAFKAGEDLHSYVGARVFGVGIDEVDSEMRARVKAMSYGLVYGLSAFGLSKQLGIGVDEARGLMDGYFERFGAVKDYLDGVVEEARKQGYTETIWGRRRYLPQLTSDRRQIREMAERAALNAPIQGSAADIMKIAMINVHRAFVAADLKSRILLQVHDEIIVELAGDERSEVYRILEAEMGSAAELSVPLDVNIGVGKSWHDAAH